MQMFALYLLLVIFFCNALSQKKTKNKGWCHHVKACYSNALIVLKPVLSYQRTIAATPFEKNIFSASDRFFPYCLDPKPCSYG